MNDDEQNLDQQAQEQQTQESEQRQDQDQSQDQEVEQQNQETEGEQQQSEATDQNQDQSEQQTSDRGSRKERRQARYIDKLTKELEDFRSKGFQQNLKNQGSNNNQSSSYKPIEYAEQDYSIDELSRDRQQFGQSQYEEGRRLGETRAEEIARTTVWRDQADRDNEYVERKYPIMDPTADEYDADVERFLNSNYLSMVGFDGEVVKNPIRYRDFVRANVEFAERMVARASAETATNIARQSGQASVKANGSNNRSSSRDWSQPGAISNLTPDEYEKHKPEIEAFLKTLPSFTQ